MRWQEPSMARIPQYCHAPAACRKNREKSDIQSSGPKIDLILPGAIRALSLTSFVTYVRFLGTVRCLTGGDSPPVPHSTALVRATIMASKSWQEAHTLLADRGVNRDSLCTRLDANGVEFRPRPLVAQTVVSIQPLSGPFAPKF